MSKDNKDPKGVRAPIEDVQPVLRPEVARPPKKVKKSAKPDSTKVMTPPKKKNILDNPPPGNVYGVTPIEEFVKERKDGQPAPMPFGFLEKPMLSPVDQSIKHHNPAVQWERWRKGLEEVVKESKKYDQANLYPSDIRSGWQKAHGEGNLKSCGLFDAPLHIIEKAEEDIKFAKRLAGIKSSTSTLGIQAADPGYIEDLKGQVAALQKKLANAEKSVEKKQKQVDTLTEVIEHLRQEATKAATRGEGELPDRHLFGDDL